VAACTAHPAGSIARQPGSQAASAPVATEAASPPAAAPSATAGPAGIQHLVVTSAERSALTKAFVAYRGVPLSEVAGGGPAPGSVYYAYDPATGTFWAAANFHEVNGLSLKAMETYQNGGVPRPSTAARRTSSPRRFSSPGRCRRPRGASTDLNMT
jgi:hypothetical protein